MAGTGLNSPQCRSHTVYASTFWYHFDASMAVFIISFFAIPSLVFLLKTIGKIPHDQSLGQSPTYHDDFNTTLACDHTSGDITTHYIPDRSRPLEPRLKTVARFVGSTILLGVVACLFTFQILVALFLRYCLDGLIDTSDVVIFCSMAAMGSLSVAFGLVFWLFNTAVFVKTSISWCRTIKRRTIQPMGELALADIRSPVSSSELQRRDEQAVSQDHVKLPAPTLPPYMV